MQKVDSWLEKALAEHRELRAEVDRLRVFLEEPWPGARAVDLRAWAHALRARLAPFREDVEQHFREEEESGFLETICEASPGATRPTRRLQAEHRVILAELDRLLDVVRVHDRGESPAAFLRKRVLELLDRFGRHEQEETELMQDVYCRDLGTGD